MKKNGPNGIATSEAWRAASRSDREARAEPLRLPSGATILAVRPDPLEWILSGRIPQKLLAAVLESDPAVSSEARRELTREEIIDLANFATQLVKASVVEPAIGIGPDEIALDEISIEDRAFIFEWACRTLSPKGQAAVSEASRPAGKEDLSSDQLERFRQK